jgi:DNA-binding response OmpR family regulator
MANPKYRIIVGDDDPLFCTVLKTVLEREGHSVTAFQAPDAFLRSVRETKPDAVFLDVLFGPADGRKLCRQLREAPATKNIAIIMVSAFRKEAEDIVEGLERGADDYLLKPLDKRFILAKLNSVMQRFRVQEELEPVIRHFGLSLDAHGRRVRAGNRDVALTRMEFDLLTYLLRRPGAVLTARQLLDAVWGYEPETYDDTATVHVHISRLRRKLGKSFSERLTTLVNAGYRLD